MGMEMEMEILGMNFTCVMGAVSAAQIPARDCVLPLVSKLLGYCIVAASTTVKLPQIMKIVKHNSVRGLSVAAFELEVVGYTIALAYCVHKGLPFSAYGELAFLLIQAIILVAIIYYYSQPVGTTTWIRALLYCAVAPTILAGQIDPFLFEALYASQHAIFFCARVPQIWKNYTNKSTGELSFLTCFMNFAGSIVRVFTSIQEKAPAITIDALKHALMTQKEYMLGSHARVARTGSNSSCSHFSLVLVVNLDLVKVIAGSLLGIVMNGTILSQILIYQKAPAKKEKKVE